MKKRHWISDVDGAKTKLWWAFTPELTLCACEEITDRENRAHWGTVHKVYMPHPIATGLLNLMDKVE